MRNSLLFTASLAQNFAAFLLCIAASISTAQSPAQLIHQERSLYLNILVTEDEDRRCMRFTISDRGGQNQSCRFLNDYDKLVFPYAKMVLSSLLVQDNPQRILIVGLGGGTLVHTYSTLFPQAEIVIAEIDEAVVRVAQEYFDFTETPTIKVATEDARVYVKRAALRGEKFDLVILDAFNGEYIPEHLMSMEFLAEVKSLLPATGMVVSNTFSTSRLYSAESVSYNQVFGKFFNVKMNGTGNRIIIAPMQALPAADVLQQRIAALQPRLDRFGMNVTEFIKFMHSESDWDTTERALTDQYAPANLLNN